MRKKAGFTLIELLVVVAIIAVLISILIPSLKEAKEQARKVVCMSNLKQIGLAVQMYLNDRKDRLPHVDTVGGGNRAYWDEPPAWPGWTHLGLLFSKRYISNPGVFFCPSGTDRYAYNRSGWFNPPEFDYGYGKGTYMYYIYRNQTWWDHIITNKKYKQKLASGTLSRTSLVADQMWGDPTLSDHEPEKGIGWNVLYLDGHVEWYDEPIDRNNPWWYWGW